MNMKTIDNECYSPLDIDDNMSDYHDGLSQSSITEPHGRSSHSNVAGRRRQSPTTRKQNKQRMERDRRAKIKEKTEQLKKAYCLYRGLNIADHEKMENNDILSNAVEMSHNLLIENRRLRAMLENFSNSSNVVPNTPVAPPHSNIPEHTSTRMYASPMGATHSIPMVPGHYPPGLAHYPPMMSPLYTGQHTNKDAAAAAYFQRHTSTTVRPIPQRPFPMKYSTSGIENIPPCQSPSVHHKIHHGEILSTGLQLKTENMMNSPSQKPRVQKLKSSPSSNNSHLWQPWSSST